MSYYMSQLGDGDFIIRRENKSAAMNALRNWEKTVLRKGESSLFGHAENLEDMLHTLGWEAYPNERGDIVEISFIDETLCDYNSSFYYQSRDYIAECYRTGHVIDA